MFQARILFLHILCFMCNVHIERTVHIQTQKENKKNNRRQYQVDENENEILDFCLS